MKRYKKAITKRTIINNLFVTELKLKNDIELNEDKLLKDDDDRTPTLEYYTINITL